MSMVDYKMSEETSKEIYNRLTNNVPVPADLFENLMTSIACLVKDNMNMGPNFNLLYAYLDNIYLTSPITKSNGFDLGAVYGSIQFLKKYKELRS